MQRKLFLPAAAVLATALVVAGPSFAGPRPDASCTNISGSVSGFAVPVIGATGLTGFNVILTSGSGPLGTSASATLTVETILPGGAIHMSGTHVYPTSPYGPLTFSDRIVVTPNGDVHNTSQVVTGGSGFLVSQGTVNLATGALALDYHGRVCSE
jgi:hypothetical protein